MSPLTTAAVGMGVGEGGNGVRVGKTGVTVPCGVSAGPPHPLNRITLTNNKRKAFFVVGMMLICVDYKRFQAC